MVLDLPIGDGGFISVHIYYNVGDSTKFILDCLRPLIDTLRNKHLITEYFFIRYWENGPHIRLRLLPANDANVGEIKAILDEALAAFLSEWPSIRDPDPAIWQPLMRQLYVAEYGLESLENKYGQGGFIPLHRNNTFEYVYYSRELERYGGITGVKTAEEHFTFSTALVFEILDALSGKPKSTKLGLAYQIMIYGGIALFPERERTYKFFEEYDGAFVSHPWAEAEDASIVASRIYRKRSFFCAYQEGAIAV